jgi:hypothetical protein
MNQPPKKTSKPGAIHLRIIEVLKQFPEGASGGQIRHELEKEGLKPEEQTHLDRRKRDLKKWFVIQKIKIGQVLAGKQRNVTLYKYIGLRKTVTDEGQIDSKMCGARCPRLLLRSRRLFKSLKKRLDLSLSKSLAIGV